MRRGASLLILGGSLVLAIMVGSFLLLTRGDSTSSSTYAQGTEAPSVATTPGWGSTTLIQNLEISTATVIVEFYSTGGTLVATKNYTIPASSSIYVKAWNLADLPSPFNGSAVVLSDKQIVAVTNVFEQSGSYPSAISSHRGVSSGASTIYLPSLHKVAADGSGWGAEVAVQNVVSTTVPVTLTITGVDGTGAPKTVTASTNISANASHYFRTSDYAELGNSFVGSGVVSSSGSVAAIVRELGVGPNDLNLAYEGFTSGSTTVYLPSIHRAVPLTNAGWNATVLVQNLSSTTSAQVTAYYTPKPGNGNAYSTTVSIPANSGTYLKSADLSGLGSNFFGSLRLVSDGAPIVAVANEVYRNTSGVMSAILSYSGVASGSTSVFLPSVHKSIAGNAWNATILVQNLSSSASTDVTISYYESGSSIFSLQKTIAAEASEYWQVRAADHAGISGLRDDFIGSALVTSSGAPVTVVVNEFLSSQLGNYDVVLSYNGFAQ